MTLSDHGPTPQGSASVGEFQPIQETSCFTPTFASVPRGWLFKAEGRPLEANDTYLRRSFVVAMFNGPSGQEESQGQGGEPHSRAERRYHLLDSDQSGEAVVYSPACASIDMTLTPAAVRAAPYGGTGGSSSSGLHSTFHSPANPVAMGEQHTTPTSFMGTSQRCLGGAFSASPLGSTDSNTSQVQHRGSRSVGSVISDLSGRRPLQKGAGTASSGASVDRRSAAEPRLLWSDLDVSGASAASSQQRPDAFGDTATSKGKGYEQSRRGPSGQGGYGRDEGGASCSPEKDMGRQEDEDEDEEARDILAVCRHGDTLGIAAYREAGNTIDIQQIHAFQSDMADTLEGIKLMIRPRLILTDLNMTNNQGLFQMIVAPLIEGGDTISFRLVKRSCWDYQSAVRGICANLKVRSLERPAPGGAGVGGGTRDRGRGEGEDTNGGGDPLREAFNRLGSIIDFQAHQQVRALGALLAHLQTTVFALEGSGSVAVNSVRQLDVAGSMRIDLMTLRSLGIMAEEFHPNVLSGKGRSKEGFSIFGLFDRTRSASGRRCLKEWMLKPLHDIDAIRVRQDCVELLMQTENAEISRRLRSQLGKSHDTTRTLLRIKKVSSTFMDWCKLIQSIETALDVRDGLAILKTRADAAMAVDGGMVGESFASQTLLARLLDGIDAVVLRRCLEGLSEVVDAPSSMEDRDVVLCTGCDEELDRLKGVLANLPDILQAVGKIVLDENPVLDELSVEYVPQIGFLTGLHRRFSDLAPPDFSFAFAQVDTVYFKNPRMHEMDDGIGDIQAQITDKQAKIMRELEEALLEQEVVLHAAAASMAELDAAMSLASVASDFGFVRPEELTVDHFIPNDTYIADGGRVALITGANCSGKSVYLKQVGVAVFLAHVGSFVPAERAIIGLTDRIFTRISTVETSALPQSSFTIDVNQVAQMVRSSTPRSLLLIDEFGKGTAPADGIGLVAALLRHLSRAGRKCLFTLHFHEIFSQGLVKTYGPDDMRTELKDVSVFRMEVHMPEGKDGGMGIDGNERDLTTSGSPIPLFKLTPGVTASSHGIACAEVAGIPRSVLSRAREVVRLEDRGEPIQARTTAEGRAEGPLTLSSPMVQDALRQFLTPPDETSWQDAPDDAVDSLLAAVDTLCKLAVSSG